MAIIEGTIEKVIFHNEDNGWTVLNVKQGKKVISVVGTLGELIAGERAVIEGEWTEHPDYGEQFKAVSCSVMPPDTKVGMEKYLSSGYVKGIGPATAKLIIKAFGLDTFRVLEEEPERLTEIAGIGRKKAERIASSFAEKQEMRQTMVFLQTYGISSGMAMKIYRTYGTSSMEVVRTQPYRLVLDIKGIGFMTADAVAQSMGISKLNPQRLMTGLMYVMSEATANGGHTYLPYDMLVRETARVLSTDMETAEKTLTEAILNGSLLRRTTANDDAVYTAQMYSAEGETAQRLALLAAETFEEPKGISEKIALYEKTSGVALSDEQREAVHAAGGRGLTVITGGPGTGKTTCIRCIIEALSGEGKIVLCAPTGRAAKRMSEASGCEAKTIHRLLEYGGDDLTFMRNEDDPIDARVVITDEVSMCDLFLMRALLRALKPGTRLILVGDRDQLPSVGAGNVLADIIASNTVKVIQLTRIYRQGEGSMIVENAHLINGGEMPVCNGKGTDFFLEKCFSAAETAQKTIDLVSERLPRYLKCDPMISIQTMSPMKKGEAGVWNLNKVLQNALNPEREGCRIRKGDTDLRLGDRVMQIRNDYRKEWTTGDTDGVGVYNGDIGFITDIDPEDRSLEVTFDEDRRALYDESDMDDLELAYCMSVHKSQGGEFDAVVLPLIKGPSMLMTRNLLYTAVTRAKKLVVIVGSRECIAAMVHNDHISRRYSDMSSRIASVYEMASEVKKAK